jgi:type I restriction enzyme S subunit
MTAMKASGVDWIGDIPSDWALKKIRFATTIRTEVGKYKPDSVFIGLENVESSTGRLVETKSECEEGTYDVFRKGDVLFSKLRPYLEKTFIADFDGLCTGEFVVFKGFDGNKRFLFYFLLSNGFIEIVNSSTYGAKMPRASWEYIKNLNMPLPGAAEQRAIAAFLDDRCGQVNGIIAYLERQVEILRQYKKALITETVTKGLDKSAPMKDSDYVGIGQIPKHYTTKKLKYIVATKITDGPHETPELIDEGIPFLSAESVKDGIFDFEYKRGFISRKDHDQFCQKCKPQRNDIFMIKSGATTGKIGMVVTDEEFSIWSPLALVRCDDLTVKQKFVYYSMLSEYFMLSVEQAWSYGTQQNIGMGIIENLTIVLPPTKEQVSIMAFLDERCTKADDLIAEKQKAAEVMRQYKKSLIYEYVTGKKRVALGGAAQ